MHSAWGRVNAVSSYAATVLAIVTLLSAVSHFHLADVGKGQATLKKLHLIGPQQFQVFRRIGEIPDGSDGFIAYFDIEADLSKTWTWNTKQLFVFVSLEYESSDYKSNSAIIWDKIITSKEEARFNLTNTPSKYEIIELPKSISNREFNITLSWDAMPIAGFLTTGHSKTVNKLSFPSNPLSLERDLSADGRVLYVPMKTPY